MKRENLPIVEAETFEIEAVLTRQREQAERDFGATTSRCNNILVVDSEDSELLTTMKHLGLLVPGRLFVIHIRRPSSEDVEEGQTGRVCAAVTGWIQRDGAGAALYSEVVIIESEVSQLPIMAALLRSLVYPGAESSLFLRLPMRPSDRAGDNFHLVDQVTRSLLPLVQQVFLSSSEIERYLDLVRKKEWKRIRIVDTVWIEFSPWREKVRQLFEHLQEGWQIQSIAVAAQLPDGMRLRTPHLIFVGWVIGRLGLEPLSLGAHGFDCRLGYSRLVPVKVGVCHEGATHSGERAMSLGRMTLEFSLAVAGGQPRGESGGPSSLLLRTDLGEDDDLWRGGSSLGEEEKGVSPSFLAWKQGLDRFFLVGESLVNYPGAVTVASGLLDLMTAYERHDEPMVLA